MRFEFDKEELIAVENAILNAIANTILDKAIMETERQEIYAFGTYEKGWEKRVGGVTEVNVKMGKPSSVMTDAGFRVPTGYNTTRHVTGEVGNTAPYAALLEWGHAPYRPPIDKLVKWVELKKGLTGEDAVKVAAKIANYFQMHGFKPHFVLTRAVTNTVRKFGGE